MEYRILGPLEIVEDGRTLTLRGSKKRALLAILLLHANEVVSRDRLIEDLWGENRPETAATALHGYVSQLRRVLEPDPGGDRSVLVTRAPGYELRVGDDRLDLRQFERLAERGKRELAAGDAEAAATTLEEAIALWRGRPLAEFGTAPFVLVENLRLEELRVSALEDRIEADLELGRHGAVIGELESLVAEHPHRERLSAYLMLALYRSGRQAEALDVYQRTRRRLVEELGIEPGTMLQQLERAILNHDPSLELPLEPAETDLATRSARRRRLSWWQVAVAALGLLAVAVGLVSALENGQPGSLLLRPNSVGFVDAESGRVTRSFAVGREPSAITIANDSVWVANYRDQTVSRIDPRSGESATIPVGGHPTGITSYRGKVWVWTLEELLVPIDPRFDSALEPIRLAVGGQPAFGRTRDPGRIVAGGGFLWMSTPGTTVIRADPRRPERRQVIVPDTGVSGPLVYGEGDLWVAGSRQVLRISGETGISGSGTLVGGVVHALAFGDDSVWVLSGGPNRIDGVAPALRRLDTRTLLQTTIPVGDWPRSATAAAGSIWVAGMEGLAGTVYRVDPDLNRVVATVTIGAIPTAVASDVGGVWVAVM